jgi:histidinol-phosphate/aromatic aminotransferase/cobyric acid decarboxylase-like protein
MIKFFSEPEFVNCVRITLGTQEQNARLLSALSEFLEAREARGGLA